MSVIGEEEDCMKKEEKNDCQGGSGEGFWEQGGREGGRKRQKLVVDELEMRERQKAGCKRQG